MSQHGDEHCPAVSTLDDCGLIKGVWMARGVVKGMEGLLHLAARLKKCLHPLLCTLLCHAKQPVKEVLVGTWPLVRVAAKGTNGCHWLASPVLLPA